MKSPLVLLHGWAVNSKIWNPILEPLAAEFELTIIDLPGYGSDTTYFGDYSLDSIASEVLARAPQKANWIAWSLGATIAVAAAIKHPERFEKLQLISPTPRFLKSENWEHGGSPNHFEKMGADFDADYQSGLRKFLLLSVLSNDRLQANPSKKLVRNVAATIIEQKTPSNRTLQAGLNILRDTDLRSQLSSVKVQTQVVAGDRDQIVPAAASRYLFDQLSNGHSFHQLQGGHLPFLQSPSKYIETLTSFIQDPPK